MGRSPTDEAEIQLMEKKRKRKHSVLAMEGTGEGKKKKKVKRSFNLPGQKRPTPSERDPSRIFYETLYKQVPGCELAQIWMMESGLLSREEAERVYEKKQRKASTPTSMADVSFENSVKREHPSGKKDKKKTERRVTVKKSSRAER